MNIERTCEYTPLFYCKKIEEELNSPLKGNVGKKSRKKRPNVFRTTITNLFVTKDPFKKDV
jgi:hypothetical protein